MLTIVDTITLPLAALAAGSFIGLVRSRRRPAPPPPSPAEEALELNLEAFMSALGPDLDRLRDFAPRFVELFAEIGLTVLALEYALRDKQVIGGEEIRAALAKTLELARRRGTLADASPAGSA